MRNETSHFWIHIEIKQNRQSRAAAIQPIPLYSTFFHLILLQPACVALIFNPTHSPSYHHATHSTNYQSTKYTSNLSPSHPTVIPRQRHAPHVKHYAIFHHSHATHCTSQKLISARSSSMLGKSQKNSPLMEILKRFSVAITVKKKI